MEDPFDLLPEGTSAGREVGVPPVIPARTKQPSSQSKASGDGPRKQSGV